MNDGELLLRAICEKPDEVTIRNQCADWFQEFRPDLPAVPAILLRPDASDLARAMLDHTPEMIQSCHNLANGRPWHFVRLSENYAVSRVVDELELLRYRLQKGRSATYDQRSTFYMRHAEELLPCAHIRSLSRFEYGTSLPTFEQVRKIFTGFGLPQIELAPWLPRCVAIWVAAPHGVTA